MLRIGWIAIGLLAAAALSAYYGLSESFEGSPDHPAIGYDQPPNDPVAALNRKLQEGSVELKYEENAGYLRSVLAALHVPIESQIVAMAKTSVQQYIITPQNPRTLYFNDSVAVGFVRGGFMELAAQDPTQGIVFYTLGRNGGKSQPFSLETRPYFRREDGCLQCHVSYATMGVPGTLLRSVFPSPAGTALYQAGSYVTDHRSPMLKRFGGWDVTGASGPARHLGNALFSDPETAEAPAKGELLPSLNARLDARPFLSPYSDIVALMVFDHQMHMMNLLTRVGWEARYLKAEHPEALPSRMRAAAEEFVDYLLFVDEAPLEGSANVPDKGRIRGNSGFAEEFAARGPRDSQGRSLRQFDLQRRLMRYPCSYMIYSEAFDALPEAAKRAIYERLWSVLSGRISGGKYARLSLPERKAVTEILRETKNGLPEYFTTVVK
jgi:hypothetical protein